MYPWADLTAFTDSYPLIPVNSNEQRARYPGLVILITPRSESYDPAVNLLLYVPPPFCSLFDYTRWTGCITSCIHVSAKTSVHAIYDVVAGVNRIGIKCSVMPFIRSRHVRASEADRTWPLTNMGAANVELGTWSGRAA